jgi:hypothetical protein
MGENRKQQLNRRDWNGLALGAAAAVVAAPPSSAATKPMIPIPPGLKIGMSVNLPSPEYMTYLKQLGVKWLSVGPRQSEATAEGFRKQREEWEAGGFQVYNIGSGVGPSGSLHNMPEVGSEDRGVPQLHPLSGAGQDPLLDLRPHGERHLVERTHHQCARVQRPGWQLKESRLEGSLGRQGILGTPIPWAGVQRAGDLG